MAGFHVEMNNKVEMHWGAVARNYLTGWFTLDAIAALPREVFGVAQNSSAKSTRVALVGLHAIKYAKIGQFLRRLHINMDIQMSPFTFNILCWAVVLFTWAHYTACINAWLWLISENPDGYLSIDVDGKDVVFDDGICGETSSNSRCLARYYLRSLRTAIGFMIGHGQVQSVGGVLRALLLWWPIRECVHGICVGETDD
jgi:hypothetical protein